jgi:hypothetical protein
MSERAQNAAESSSWPEPDSGPNRTGGLVWHLRALRAGARWRPTRVAIDSWLAESGFESRELIWIGPSAGWMVPTAFPSRFERVVALDIDPLARPLFFLRHGVRLRRSGVEVTWLAWDALARLDEVLARWPRAAVLFDNVLGQQIYRTRHLDALEQALAGLAARLHEREWASIHDWLSGPADPPRPDAVFVAPPSRIRVEADGLRYGPSVVSHELLAQTFLERLGGHGDWQDHRTGRIFPIGSEVRVIPWEFLPGKWHWLQAGHVKGVAGISADPTTG